LLRVPEVVLDRVFPELVPPGLLRLLDEGVLVGVVHAAPEPPLPAGNGVPLQSHRHPPNSRPVPPSDAAGLRGSPPGPHGPGPGEEPRPGTAAHWGPDLPARPRP